MRKLICFLLVVVFSLSSLSCATLKDKFVRKKGKEKEEKQVFQATNDVYPPDVRYNNHWIYYEIWVYETIDSMGDNHKKTYNSAQRALYNLKEMQILLKEPWASELNPYITQMASFTKELKSSGLPNPRQKKIAEELRIQVRDVKKQFSSDVAVANSWIKPDAD
jgi:hypothetical protein